MLQAIHLRMPKTMLSENDNQAVIYSSGSNTSVITNVTNDNTSIYNPDCQSISCFLIQFNYTDI